MDILTIDFETYYAKDYGLRKFTLEEYIRADKFEVIGVAVKTSRANYHGETVWCTGPKQKVQAFLDGFDWENSVAVAHNAMFDMAILNWHFDIRPKKIVDTLSMARAIHTIEVGGSLSALATYYNLGKKGTEVNDALGKRRLDFTEEEMHAYGGYCIQDVDLTYKLFKVLIKRVPIFELDLIDLTMRMFTEPALVLDKEILEEHLATLVEDKAALMARVTHDRKQLTSNPQFAALLESYGVVPPTKISLTTGKEAFAFAKTDEAFKKLAEHENPEVQALVAARLGVKSTLEETRTARFIGIASRGQLPVPLKYYAAHTGRWGGFDKINMQNLTRGSKLKYAICAPEGFSFIDCDLSQIEARMLAWLAGEDSLVEAFARGDDVYKIMAASIYGKDVADITKGERFVGKQTILGCISEGTPVLCDSGWKPIEQVSVEDKLWDGENWICHQGLVEKGLKETVNICGSWLTPDHRVLCGTKWKETASVVQDVNIRSLALDTGAANLPSRATSRARGVGLTPSLLVAAVAVGNTLLIPITSKTSVVRGVIYVLKKVPTALVNFIGGMQRSYQTTSTANAYSTGYHPLSEGAIPSATSSIKVMGGGAYKYTQGGERTGVSSLATYKRLTGGMYPLLRWIGLIMTRGTSPTTYGSPLGVKTCLTGAASSNLPRLLQTFDLAYAGPNNRFTIGTDEGPLIVHNCGYGMGPVRFQAQLGQFNVKLPIEECERIIKVYRATYTAITKLWKEAGNALKAMQLDKVVGLGCNGALLADGEDGILLPNGLYVSYPNLRVEVDEEGESETLYDTLKGRTLVPTRIYGGKVIENVCQALSRIVIGEQLLAVSKEYKVVMTVHDAIGALAPTVGVVKAMQRVEELMKIRPAWAPDLPLDCEGGYGESYGSC